MSTQPTLEPLTTRLDSTIILQRNKLFAVAEFADFSTEEARKNAANLAAAYNATYAQGINPAAVGVMKDSIEKAENLFAFHEGSEKPEFVGAEPTIRINHEDYKEVLALLRKALALTKGAKVS